MPSSASCCHCPTISSSSAAMAPSAPSAKSAAAIPSWREASVAAEADAHALERHAVGGHRNHLARAIGGHRHRARKAAALDRQPDVVAGGVAGNDAGGVEAALLPVPGQPIAGGGQLRAQLDFVGRGGTTQGQAEVVLALG